TCCARSSSSPRSASSAPRSRSSRRSSSRRCAMRLDNVAAVAKREDLQRMKGKGLRIATLMLPLFVTAMKVRPTLLPPKFDVRQRIAVVEGTGKVAGELQGLLATDPVRQPKTGKRDDAHVRFDLRPEAPRSDTAAQRADLDRRVRSGQIDAWIWIDAGALA